MNEKKIEIGDILTDVEVRISYRIIYLSVESVEVCSLQSKKLDLSFLPIGKVQEEIFLQKLTHEKNDKKVVDLAIMSEEERKKFIRNKEIMNQVIGYYGPTFESLMGKKPKGHLYNIAEKYNIPNETLRRLYVKYIQSGCTDSGLLDARFTSNRKQKRKEYEYKNKPGRKAESVYSSQVIITDEIKRKFEEALKYYKSGRAKSFERAYEWLCARYYSQTQLINGALITTSSPMAEIPTIYQFYYYVQGKVDAAEKDIIKTSRAEQRNNKRLLLSDSLNGVLGPGDLAEIDAVEVDVSLVSELDRAKTVGRPIIYIIIDVYTRMIIAMSISYDNNSEVALTNCFLNLADDKIEYCKKYDISISEEMWKSNIIPRRIRCDRGADFRSLAFEGVCNNLGIDRQLVSAASGSLKGTVEQVFHQLHCAQNVHFENKGLIEKRYDSEHHKEALMTISEYTRIVISFVLAHNAKCVERYPLTKDMIEHGVHSTPIELWKYGAEKYGNPRPISNKNQFIFDLLVPKKASLNKRGIKVNGLYYMNWDDSQLKRLMYRQQDKVLKMEIRYDPRDVGYIYYLRDGELMVAKLNENITGNADYMGMTYKELKEFQKKKKESLYEGKKLNTTVNNSLFLIDEKVVETATDKSKSYSSEINMRVNRESERQNISQQNNVINHMDNIYEKRDIDEKINPLKSRDIPDNFIDALDEFDEDY